MTICFNFAKIKRSLHSVFYLPNTSRKKHALNYFFLTWKRSTDIDILELLDGLPELDERGNGLPDHHGVIVRPAGVKGEVVEGGVVDPLSEQSPLQGTGHQLLLEQSHSNVKQATHTKIIP